MGSVIGLVIASVIAVGCGKRASDGGGKPSVAVSIFPIHDLAKRIAGDRLDVLIVLPPGKSEHSYEPGPQEAVKLSSAKLAFVVGLGMDSWVEPVVRGARIVRLGDKVPTIPIDLEPIGEGEEHHDDHDADHHDDHGKDDHDKDDHDDHDKGSGSGSAAGSGSAVAPAKPAHDDHGHAEVGAPDPHFWMDPERMIAAVDVITAELSTLDPAGKETFAKNAEAVKASLRTLDASLQARSKAWTKRTIVTFHGSMTYFAKRYNLRIAAVVEPVAGSEPTAAYQIEVLSAIKRGQAAAIFSEPQLDRAPGESIAREAKIPLGELDPVGGLAGRDTYETLLTWNADQLDKVLK